jgi:hypothetical protein
LKPEWWGSPLVQEEKYQEKPMKREEIIIIIITTGKAFTRFSTKTAVLGTPHMGKCYNQKLEA